MAAPDRLYGLPHSETLRSDLASVWECDICHEYPADGWIIEYPADGWIIEEWTVSPPSASVPSPLVNGEPMTGVS